MNNQYIETGNNQRPSLTMWQYYWRAWTFPREKRASLREGNMVFWGMCSSSMILGFFIVIILEIFSGDLGLFKSFSFAEWVGHVVGALMFTVAIVCIFILLQLFTIPGIPLFIRRVHDTGKSAWWPFILSHFVFFPCHSVFMNQKGDPNTNKYGPPPTL